MSKTPDKIFSQWKASPIGLYEQATILLKNKQQMNIVALAKLNKAKIITNKLLDKQYLSKVSIKEVL